MSLKSHIRAALAQILASGRLEGALGAGHRFMHRIQGKQPTLRFFYDFSDPINYLAIPRAVELAGQYAVRCEYYPLEPLTPTEDPIAQKRMAYSLLDARREAQRRGLEAMGGLPPAQGIHRQLLLISQALIGTSQHPLWMLAVSRAIWHEEANLEDPSVLAERLAGIGLESKAVLEQANLPKTAKALAANRQRVQALRHWGTPLWALDGGLFHGPDRDGFLVEKLNAYPRQRTD